MPERIPFYKWFKESYNQNPAEWKAFIIIAIILIVVYSTRPFDLLKSIIQWAFVGLGADLIIFKKLKKDETKM